MSELESMSSISENEDTPICPLCYNELDATDQSLLPCPCNFQVLWMGIRMKNRFVCGV